MLFPASFKLALMCCSCLHHLLPWVASCSFIMHHACCASCLVYEWCVYFVVRFFSIVPVSLRSWGFVCIRLVRLHPFVFFMDSFFFLAGFQARWSYPRNHYYLCYASLLALLLCQCYDAYHLLSSLPNCHVKPLTHHVLANRCLAMLPLCSAPLIALLVAGEDWSRSLLEHLFTYWDIIILLCYLNASIYLVKGGRLGLSPSVLFHSCRPSFPSYRCYVPGF